MQHRLRLVLNSALFLVIIAGMVTAHVIDLGQSSWLTAALRNALHAPAFGLVSVMLYCFFRQYFSRHRSYFLVTGLTLTLAFASEAIQVIGPRDGDISDLGRDALGIATALISIAVINFGFASNRSVWIRVVSGTTAATLVTAVTWPAVSLGHAYAARERQLPVLLSFDHGWEKSLYARTTLPVRIQEAPENWPIQNGKVARLTLRKTEAESLFLEPSRDWRRFSRLSFLAASTSAPQTVALRIHDTAHNNRHDDRFNATFSVDESPRRYSFELSGIADGPANRRIDLEKVAGLIIFSPISGGDGMYLDDIRLE